MGLISELLTEEDLLNFFDNSISVILNGKVLDLQNSNKDDFKNATLKLDSNLLKKPIYLKNYFIQDYNKKIEKINIHNYFRLQLKIDEKTGNLLKKHIKPGYISATNNEKSYEFTSFMEAYKLHKSSKRSGLISFNLNLVNRFNGEAIFKEYMCKMEIKSKVESDEQLKNPLGPNGFKNISLSRGGDNLSVFLHKDALFDGPNDPLYLKLVKYNNLICQYLYLSMITDNAAQEHLTEYLKSAKKALRSNNENFRIGEDERDILNIMFDMSKEKFDFVERINNYKPTDVYHTESFLINYEDRKKSLEKNPITRLKR